MTKFVIRETKSGNLLDSLKVGFEREKLNRFVISTGLGKGPISHFGFQFGTDYAFIRFQS